MIEWKQIACVIDREGGGWAKYERYVDGVREEKEEPWGSPPREGERMSEMEKVPMIEELKALLTAATPTPWQWGVHSEPTLTELGDYAKTMMEKRDGLTCHMAFISDPEDADNEGKYLTTAVVGNGPTSEANAKLIVWAVNALPHLLAELDALRAERRECPECSVVCADCGCTWRDHHAIDAVLECGNCGHRPCGGAFSSPKTEAALGAQEGSGDGE
jgi:hypothetical protein